MNKFVGLGIGGEEIPLEALQLDFKFNCLEVVVSKIHFFKKPPSTRFNISVSYTHLTLPTTPYV